MSYIYFCQRKESRFHQTSVSIHCALISYDLRPRYGSVMCSYYYSLYNIIYSGGCIIY